MAATEYVSFSPQICTVVLEHIKGITRFLKSGPGLTYYEFTVLLALHEAGNPVLLDGLCDYVMLKRGTLWHMLLALEDRGLIRKESDEHDARLMLISLSDKGVEMVATASQNLADYLANGFWPSLPILDFYQFMRESAKLSVDAVRGHSVPTFEKAAKSDYVINSGFFLLWATMVNEWEIAIKQHEPLTLNEYRILNLLEGVDSVSSKSIAQSLLVPLSLVSAGKRKLINKGFVEEAVNPFDARSKVLRLTPEARGVLGEIETSLDAATKASHEGITVVNAWYMRMYSNIRKQHR